MKKINQKKILIVLMAFVSIIVSIILAGCVTPTYQYDWWEYDPIDSNIHHPINRPQLVYIPRYRPKPLYLYENFWYAEPYTVVIYEDDSGYRLRQKVPNSHLKFQLNKSRPYMKRKRDVESIMKRVDEERKKMHNNIKKRRKNIKVLEKTVDNDKRSTLQQKRRRTRERTKGRI